MHHTYVRRGHRAIRQQTDETDALLSRLERQIRTALADAARYRNLSFFALAVKELDAAEGYLVSLNLLSEHYPHLRPRVDALLERLLPKEAA